MTINELKKLASLKNCSIEIEQFDQSEQSVNNEVTYTIYLINNETDDWENVMSVKNLLSDSINQVKEYFWPS